MLLVECAKSCQHANPELVIDSFGINEGAEINVWCDKEIIRNAIEEVISNSVRELTFRNVESPIIHIAANTHGGEFWLSITDNGLPVDVQLIANPFEEGATTYERVGLGTGLGLAIVRESFQSHGGDCTLQPNFDEHGDRFPGTSFHGHLPLSSRPNQNE